MCTGSVNSFTSTVLAGDSSATVTVTGIALDPMTSRGSVRSIRFELAETCTATSASANSVAQPVFAAVSASADLLELRVPLVNTTGLSGGQWSVCVDWVAASVVPSFVRVGNSSLYVTVGACGKRV